MAYNPFANQSVAQNQSIGQPMTASERARRFLRNNSTWQSWTGQNVSSTPATQTYAQQATPAFASSFENPTQVRGGDNQSLEIYGPVKPKTTTKTSTFSSTPVATSINTPTVTPSLSAQQIADQRGLTGIARQRFIEAASGIIAQPAKLDGTFSTQASKTPTVTETPTVSSIQRQYDTAQKQYDDARKRFLGLLDNQEVADLERQLADYRAATQSAITGEEGQGRGKTTSLVRGRQALLEQQRGIQEQNLLSQLDITRNLLDQKQNAAYQAMGFAKEDLDNVREQVLTEGKTNFGEIKEFGDRLLRIAPDGTVTELAKKQTEAAKPITVSAGQTVIDPNTGEILFQAGEKPEALPSSIQEYMFATQQGYTGTYNDFKNQSSSTAGKALSAEASKLIANANSGLAAIQTMLQTVDSNLGRGVLGNLTNREYKAAEANLVDIIGRMRSGGAITTDEATRFQQLLPSVFDTDVLARQKLQNIQSLLNDTISGVQGSTQIVPAPTNPQNQMYYNLLQGGQITPQEYQELTGSFSNDLSTSQNGSMDSFKAAIAKQESGGNYGAIGPTTSKGNRAYGKYQVMDFNIPSWTQQALGRSMTPQQFLNDPQAQEAVASYKFNEIYNKYGNWGDVASVWFSGRPVSQAGNASDVTGTTVPGYVRNILSMMG